MLKLSSRAALIFLSTTLAFASVACSSDRPTTDQRDNVQPVAKRSSPSAAPATGSPTPATMSGKDVESDSSQLNQYELALDKAYSAFSISQSAQSSDDWNLVVKQWSDAISLLKAVPTTNPDKVLAKKKITEYQRNLAYARQQATRPIEPHPDSVVAVIPETPLSPPRVYQTDAQKVPFPLTTNQSACQATIKRRASGTPVIDVTFNGTQRFEMIVDTGASGTMITQQMATALGVVPVAKAKANTASANAVEFPIGYVDSIEVGGAVIKNVPIAIAPSPGLEIGLLGHDFFGNYDVTIKRDLVEFHSR